MKEKKKKKVFIYRFADRFKHISMCCDEMAKETSKTFFEDWDGVGTPEECADEEFTYWD